MRQPRVRTLVGFSLIAMWLAIAVLLVRIASSGTFVDFGYLALPSSRVVVAMGTVILVGDVALVLGVSVWRGRQVFTGSALWAAVTVVFGVYLALFADHSSGWLIAAVAGIAGGLSAGGVSAA